MNTKNGGTFVFCPFLLKSFSANEKPRALFMKFGALRGPKHPQCSIFDLLGSQTRVGGWVLNFSARPGAKI
jgi:hypothetical protein